MKHKKPIASLPSTARPIPKAGLAKADSVEGLRELQRLFLSCITRPPGPEDRAQAKDDRRDEMASLASRLFRPSTKQSPFDRLEIYHRQYWLRLREALSEDFPGLETLLGSERFHGLLQAYLLRYPPTSPMLRDLGSRLPRFLREEPDRTAPYPRRLVLDLARFEWAKIVAFYAPEHPLPRKEEGTTPETSLFLQPHVLLLDLRYPVERWTPESRSPSAPAEGAPAGLPPLPKSGQAPIPPDPRRIVLHRQGQTVYHKILPREAFFLLRSFAKGSSLLQACARTGEKFPDLPPDRYREWFQEWASLGWWTTQPRSRSRSAASKSS
ncbi:MAG: DNA-binding domain-containing protein [Methylacidiphilaceae bacterium]|nr:DNA-binding domain-containing protein [Candidatus Methylacidiphilaceae bacterium]